MEYAMDDGGVVLYCGMADDILAPFILVPDFSVLFVIDMFDSAFARGRTLSSQRSDIIETLRVGSDKHSFHREVLRECRARNPVTKITKPETIFIADRKTILTMVVRIGDKVKDIVIYNERDFHEIWPNEIRNVRHLMTMGADFKFMDFMSERVLPDCLYYQLAWNAKVSDKVVKHRGEDISVCHLRQIATRKHNYSFGD